MRSFLIVFIAIVAIGGGFFLYTTLQSAPAKKPMRNLSSVTRMQRPTPSTHSLQGLQTGEDAWVKRYDPKTGELASQFTGEQYEPIGGGMVHVVNPKADFFSKDGKQRIRVEGKTGNVQMNVPPNEKPGGGTPGKMQADAPSRGKLQDVVIHVFEPLDAAEPTIVAKMNNAAFDNDTYRIVTEAYDDPATGQHVEADQVPVTVRGKDYDFDGRGLVIKWNDRDRRLQLLQVEHGESLTIKNPSALSSPGMLPAAPATQPTAMSAMLASADPRAFGVVLAAAKPAKSAAKPAKNSAAAKRTAARKRPLPTTGPSTRPKIERDLSPVVYRATFERDVRIFEADKQVIAAEQMNIDLLQDSSHSDKNAATGAEATTKPGAAGTASKHPHHATTGPATVATAQGTKRSKEPATAPTTQASQIQGPIVVKWQGKLRVVPLEGKPDPTLVAGKAKVQLVGSPVVLTREGSEGRCGTVIYNTADGNASLRSSSDVANVIMTDAQGAKVTTPQIDYVGGEGAERLANLIGPSHVEFPVEGENGVKQRATAAWTDRCVLKMADSSSDGSGKMAIERADLFGAVKVDHPELNMTADALSLAFDPAKGKPAGATQASTTQVAGTQLAATQVATTEPAANPSAALREVIARGNVKCRVATTQKVQTIDAQNLRLETAEGADGKRYAKRLQADGDVRTSEDGRELRAGSLVAELAPTTRPVAATTAPAATGTPVATTVPASAVAPVAETAPAATGGDAALASASVPSTKPANPFNAGGDVKLVSLLASDNVKLTTPGPDGSTATADKLTVGTRDGVETYTLYGKPDAVVTSGKTTIIGPMIRMMPDQKLAEILGAGTLKGADPNDPKQIIDIAWGRGAVMNGMADRIDVSDKVVVKSVQSDGTINTATSDRLIARLTPKPTTAPAAPTTFPAKTPFGSEPQGRRQASATKPSTKPSDSTDPGNFLAGKEITHTTLLGNVKVKSELFNADGTLARGMNLLSEQVDYDRLTGQMDVPVAGQMLYQDHRASADTNDGPTMGGGRGATAFGWTKSLVYDQAGQVATMNGNVQVAHQPDTGAGQKFDLRGQTLRAFFEPDPAATKPTTKTASATPASQPMADTSKFRLKRVAMDDDVHVTSPRLNFDARNMSYDPIQQVLKAGGDEHSPVTVFDNESGGTTTASDLEWNTKTDQFKIRKLTSKMRK